MELLAFRRTFKGPWKALLELWIRTSWNNLTDEKNKELWTIWGCEGSNTKRSSMHIEYTKEVQLNYFVVGGVQVLVTNHCWIKHHQNFQCIDCKQGKLTPPPIPLPGAKNGPFPLCSLGNSNPNLKVGGGGSLCKQIPTLFSRATLLLLNLQVCNLGYFTPSIPSPPPPPRPNTQSKNSL